MKKGQRFLAFALGLMIGLSLLTVSVLAAMDAAGTDAPDTAEVVTAVTAVSVLATDSDTTTPTPAPTPVVTASPGNTSSIFGDANADGEVDEKDVVRVMRCALGTAQAGDPAKGDFNRDGKLDVLDVIRLLRWLAGENVSVK